MQMQKRMQAKQAMVGGERHCPSLFIHYCQYMHCLSVPFTAFPCIFTAFQAAAAAAAVAVRWRDIERSQPHPARGWARHRR